MHKEKFYITTAIAYASGKPHIGNVYEIILSDANGIEVINECVPFGVIPEDCNPSMDTVIDKSGIAKQYFSVDVR